MGDNKVLKIALAGRPNSGKSTIFSAITGIRQHIGNYPGVTVEKKQGVCDYKGFCFEITDLPGIYSLNAYSEDERISRDFLLNEDIDVVVNIVDASDLEKNLYLTLQLIELNVPLILVFNMMDIAEKFGYRFNIKRLSEILGAPIVRVIGNKGEGLNELLETIINYKKGNNSNIIRYESEIERVIDKIVKNLEKIPEFKGIPERYIAIKLLENDQYFYSKYSEDTLKLVSNLRKDLENLKGEGIDVILASARYAFISGMCQDAIQLDVEKRHEISDFIDRIVLHPLLAWPIFIAVMYGVFKFTFMFGNPLGEYIDSFFGYISSIVDRNISDTNFIIKSLLIDGIISGVGSVLVFLPNILLLFLALALLEASGYMARIAFIMDRLMHYLGLHGKSFIPMLLGFGCSVPAIMATRIIENKLNRFTTLMIIPLMSCGARLPIYTLIISSFFSESMQANMLFLIYTIGVLIAIVTARILKSTLFKGESDDLVIELPIYRMPTIKTIWIQVWWKAKAYLKKAGTIILGFSIVLWFLSNFPRTSDINPSEYNIRYSYIGRLGRAIEPIVRPLGFDWKIATSFLGALPAKELFVSQLAVLYSNDEENSKGLQDILKREYSPLVGFCIMLFALISAPCMATIAITKRETGSWGWALFQLGGLTILAYFVTLVVYQVGSMII